MEKRERNGRPSERKIEKRQQEEEENVPLSGGARLLFQRGFAISILATRHFLRDTDYRSYYTSRQPLNNNYLHTHSTAVINLGDGISDVTRI